MEALITTNVATACVVCCMRVCVCVCVGRLSFVANDACSYYEPWALLACSEDALLLAALLLPLSTLDFSLSLKARR